jgi:hypothetical protein
MTRSLPLGATLGRAVAFVPRALAGAWGVLILLAAVVAAPALVAPGLVAKIWWGPVLAAAGLTVGLMADGALYRLGVSADAAAARRLGLRIGGVQFGRAELRLVGAGALVLVFLGVVGLAAGVAMIFAAKAVGVPEAVWSAPDAVAALRAALAPWKVAVLVALAGASVWVVAQLAVRLALYKAATVARGRVVSTDALGLSEGNFWRLLIGLVVVLAPTWGMVAWGVCRPDAPGSQAYMAVNAVVTALVQAPLAAGFLSEAYKKLEYWREGDGGR